MEYCQSEKAVIGRPYTTANTRYIPASICLYVGQKDEDKVQLWPGNTYTRKICRTWESAGMVFALWPVIRVGGKASSPNTPASVTGSYVCRDEKYWDIVSSVDSLETLNWLSWSQWSRSCPYCLRLVSREQDSSRHLATDKTHYSWLTVITH